MSAKAVSWFLKLTAIMVMLVGHPMPTHAESPAFPQRPNFLVLFADDQRADTIHAWGNPNIHTPNVDRLVKRGTSFRRNYCFGSNSGAVCIPSRAMLMSGRTWFDVRSNLEGAVLLPEVLGAHGYNTFATGKWHNERPSFARAFQRGRSVFFGGMDDHTKLRVVDFDGQSFTSPRQAARFSSEEFASTAIDFLKNADRSRPFFCYVAFTAPHDPRNPPEEFRRMYYQQRPPLPGNFLPQHPFDNGWAFNVRDENLAPYPRTAQVISDQLCEYYGLISHLDAQIGRILEELARSPFANNTYVIYAADHGLALGSHGLLGKQSVYEHSMRCPLILAGPGIPRGRSIDAFTYLFDLYPTIVDLARTGAPPGLAGQTLRPLWTGDSDRIRDSVFLPYTDTMRAVRDDRWKLIVYPQIRHRQLFDLANDPLERTNLVDRPVHQPTVNRLLGLMEAWQNRTGDRQLLEVPNPKPMSLTFDGFVRKPDEWQPDWIVRKYFP